MNFQLRCLRLLLCFVPVAAFGSASIAPGTTRDDLLKAHGAPASKIEMGTKEIYTYAEGKVILENGAVVSSNLTALPQASAPGGARDSASSEKAATPRKAHGWLTDFNRAKSIAAADGRSLLVLFTGSDWCPGCITFEREVAHDRRFLENAQKEHVLVMLDYPRSKPQSAGLKQQNKRLQDQYKPPYFPSLFRMKADGSKPQQLELNGAKPEQGYVDAALAAIGADTSGIPASSGSSKLRIFGPIAALGLIAWFIFRR